ncbi:MULTISPECIES: TonB-dependent siderophore receptor [Nostoc]|uniref:TonB-dependent siderophore receptor n=2 Tax=Nostoc TaxID=1177 RepID=A0ABR8I7E4_9NOSO|nr:MULTISPECIES: TonB-dependent siderophore receptor [Nostoc]MBD2561568.1 TonB-dependent siderophore receptor [Nostoc linckia FACHB-391]MBD2646706.1 TonB-dependent siderophore receptor [Nostoc foliaceum FACHB-393]
MSKMNGWIFLHKQNLWLVPSLIGYIFNFAVSVPVAAQVESDNQKLTTDIPQLSEVKFPASNIKGLLSQSSTPVIQVTAVQANPTDKGVEVILQTTQGEKLQITNRSAENNFIADIPNAQLRLPNGDGFIFRSQKPVTGIAEITVTNLDANTIRVTVAGEAGVPVVELFDGDEGLIIGLTPATTAMQPPQQPEPEQPTSETSQETPSAESDEPIELVVTAEQDGYRVPNTLSATRTDTPLRDIPQSIQVIPQQVIKDQQATRLTDVLKNAPGVVVGSRSPRDPLNVIKIRGFDAFGETLLNGIQDRSISNIGFGSNIERVEVLKGPASVLFGQGGLGGKVNLVTKQPLSDPFYSVETSVGNYNTYSGAIDLSGPLNDSKTVLYRLNASARTNESFVDFFDQQQYLIAPTLSWQISDRTKLTLEASYSLAEGPYDFGIPAQGSVLPNPNGRIPRNRSVSEPNLNDASNSAFRIGYNFEHRFSDNWQARSVFQTSLFRLRRNLVFSYGLQDDLRTLERGVEDFDYDENVYNLDNYVVGKFATGSIKHELVAGFNLSRTDTNSDALFNDTTPLDVFNPVYGTATEASVPDFNIKNRAQQLGFYLQDQITLAENFKLLLGGRFDIANQEAKDLIAQTNDFKQTEAFSPRLGIVYQPIKPISLYASYSRSFNQAVDLFGPALPEPERGTQYEIGVKADLTDRLATTLAFYDLTRTNLSTTDPNNPQRTIQVGEQRSRGIEFDISGEILPGWNIIAGYAYTDAEITRDNTLPVGNQLNNVPRHALNLWTTYEIQSGSLKGLGFGLGAFYYGDRQANLANTAELPSYVRTDAAIYYKRDNYRAAINIKNLFDTDYFVSAQNINRIIPGDPLTIQGTISWQF